MIFRNINCNDYDQYIKLIDSTISKDDYNQFINEKLHVNHQIIIIEENKNILGTGTLFIEDKMTYGGCKMGHIENILIDTNYRGKRLGECLVKYLLNVAKENKCYRVDLTCNKELEKFYKKNKFTKNQISMSILFNENFNMHLIINSNTCVGSEIYKRLNKKYISPLIGTLIPNDDEYIEFVNKFQDILNSPINVTLHPKKNTSFERQSQNKYYQHRSIAVPYPIIQIENIDIHCIHENNCDEALEKFKRRFERSKNIIQTSNYKILNVLVFTELINEYNDYQEIINDFLTNEDIHTINIFLGPNKYKDYPTLATILQMVSHTN